MQTEYSLVEFQADRIHVLESSSPRVNKISAFIKQPWYTEVVYHILCSKPTNITAFQETGTFTVTAGVS